MLSRIVYQAVIQLRIAGPPFYKGWVKMRRDVEQIEIQQITALVSLANKRVLEVGCGAGRLTEGLAPLAGSYWAIDTDERALSVAQASVSGVTFREGSGEHLPFRAGEFDLVLFSLSLHHQKAEMALAEAARVLRKDGTLIALEPSAEGEVQRLFHLAEDESEALRRTQEALLSAACFKRLEYRNFTSLWRFQSAAELLEYDFGQKESQAVGFEKHVQMLLGPKMNESPIILDDRLVLTLLARTT
jgi:ubiquinone/menaquinone biosynthesis C-methylase UbiE